MSLSVTSGRRDPSNAPARRRRSRGTGQRTRTGCLTCKRRRVKCDETKPACRRCTDFGRQCEGYPDLSSLSANRSTSRLSSPSTPLGLSLSASSSRRSSFSRDEFDVPEQYTMPTLPGYFAPGFWPELIERVANSESAAQHALNSLTSAHSALVQNQRTNLVVASGSSVDQSTQETALQEYNAAITQLARIMMTRDTHGTETILVCCFLFVCIEAIFDNQGSAIQHAEAGLRVYQEWLGNASPPSSIMLTSSSENSRYCIWRLAMELENFLSEFVDRTPLQVSLTYIEDDTAWAFNSDVLAFETLEHVSSALIFMRRGERRLAQAISASLEDGISEHLLQQHRELGDLWKAFDIPYDGFMSSIDPARVNREVLVLQIQYLTETLIHDSMLKPLDEAEATQRYTDILDTAVMILRPIPLLPDPPFTISRDFSDSSFSGYNMATSSRIEATYLENPTPSAILSNPAAIHVPTFSLVGEVVPAILHTAKAARAIDVRERAIRLLHSCNAVEGIWTSYTCAKQAEEKLETELTGTSLTIFT